MTRNYKLLKLFAIVLPLIFALFLMTRYVNLPFVGPNSSDENNNSMIALNFNKFGYLNTKFAPIVLPYDKLPAQPFYYFHHPVFSTIAMSIFYKILGYGFWVGRLSVIIPAFLSLILVFLIGKYLKNTNFAILALIVSCLIPSFIVFGRMIHFPGAWTMFFILSTAYLSLKYLKEKNKYILPLTVLCVVLGTLSDWPMLYFTPFLLPLFYKYKKTKQGLFLILASILTAGAFLMLSFLLLGNFNNLIDSILIRSAGTLVSLPYWPALWLTVLSIRFILYFNPVFTFFAIVYVFYFVKKIKKNKLEDFDLLLFALFGVGVTQIILYPEGSFGHPFWIYLLTPFVALAASEIISTRLKKSYFLVAAIIIFGFIFILRIEDWKTQQDVSQLYRYSLAKQISPYFKPYDTLDLNPDSAINGDLLQYVFSQNVRFISLPANDFKKANFYIYSCTGCVQAPDTIKPLMNKYEYREFDTSPGKAFIFFLKEKRQAPLGISVKNAVHRAPVGPQPALKQSLFRRIYTDLINILQVPQL